jgi:excisionase family DNA binding protein
MTAPASDYRLLNSGNWISPAGETSRTGVGLPPTEIPTVMPPRAGGGPGVCVRPAFLTVRTVSSLLGHVKTASVLRLIHSGQLKAVNVSAGRRPTWRIPVAEFEAFVIRRSGPPTNGPAGPSRRRPWTPSEVTQYFRNFSAWNRPSHHLGRNIR